MPTIKSCDIGHSEPHRERDDRRIGPTERQVPVPPDEIDRPPVVVQGRPADRKSPSVIEPTNIARHRSCEPQPITVL